MRLRADAANDPLDPLPYFLLGASAAASGQTARAIDLLDSAVLRDPRFAPALALRLQESYFAGQKADTVAYALRLLTLRPFDRPTVDFVAVLSADPQSRARIFRALARNPDWRSGYLSVLSAKYGKTSIVYQAIGIGSDTPGNLASQRAQLLQDLIAQRDYDRAYTAWVSWLPASALSAIDYVYDGGFKGAPGAAPFNWQFDASGAGGMPASMQPGGGLAVNVDGTAEVVPATQLLLLPPGRYQLVTTLGEVSVNGTDALSPLVWRVKCADQPLQLVETAFPPTVSNIRFSSSVFDVPATCAAQSLELHAKAEIYPSRTALTIKSVAIRNVP